MAFDQGFARCFALGLISIKPYVRIIRISYSSVGKIVLVWLLCGVVTDVQRLIKALHPWLCIVQGSYHMLISCIGLVPVCSSIPLTVGWRCPFSWGGDWFDLIWLWKRTINWRSIRVYSWPDGRLWLIWLECRTASDWSRLDEALAWLKVSSAARTIEALHP